MVDKKGGRGSQKNLIEEESLELGHKRRTETGREAQTKEPLEERQSYARQQDVFWNDASVGWGEEQDLETRGEESGGGGCFMPGCTLGLMGMGKWGTLQGSSLETEVKEPENSFVCFLLQ